MSEGFEIGETFAGHRIDRRLGRGGMAVVYLATHVALQRQVALKVMDEELARDDDFMERFLRESRVAASLDHPNIVPVFQAGEAEGLLFLSMKYIDGADLSSLLHREAPFGPQRAVALLDQVASALDLAHRHGLIHRDVKPANILVQPQNPSAPSSGARSERAFLADFGLTKRSQGVTKLTKAGQFVGTIDYIAPEQIEGRPFDARTDIYSLGCVLYECLTGSVPFPKETEVAVIYAHLRDDPPQASAHRPGLGRALDTVVATAMATAPADRYESASAFAAAATEALREVTTPAPHRFPGSTIVAARHADATRPHEAESTVLAPGPAAASATVSARREAAGESTVLTPAPAAASETVSARREAGVEERDAAPRWRGRPPPIFRPPAARRSRRLTLGAVVVLGAAVGVAAAFLLRSNPGNRTATVPLRVIGVSLAVSSSATGHCPSAIFTFVGHIAINGSSGNVAYRWLQPDGHFSTTQHVAVDSGQRDVNEDLLFTFTGSRQFGGSASLQVLSPAPLSSRAVAVRYMCP
jgi:tRNA A-37 threonylcarbamoyl transferase component Bud32